MMGTLIMWHFKVTQGQHAEVHDCPGSTVGEAYDKVKKLRPGAHIAAISKHEATLLKGRGAGMSHGAYNSERYGARVRKRRSRSKNGKN